MVRIVLTLIAATAFSMCAAGCLVMGGKEISQSGTRITGATLSQIEPGVTTREWLLTAIGEPTSRSPVPNDPGVEIFRYQHREERSQGTAVFLIFAGGSDVEQITTTYFEIRDGIVTRFWTES